MAKQYKRYPGTRPFRDDKFDRMLFKGRSKEIQQLLHLILAENLVVLFAKSGVGKSSLLNAGVFQLLREKNYFPIRIRMNDPKRDFILVIDEEAKSVAKDYKIDATSGDKESLWQYFKTAEFWSKNDILLTPVLEFDQFEEIFTSDYTQEKRKDFFLQLADLVLGRIPELLKKNKVLKDKLYSEKPPNIKVVISLREDFLANLEELATDIPSILRNRFRLQTLTGEQAREAIEEPARLENEDLTTKQFSYDENAVNTIIKFLEQSSIDTYGIEPFQLQLLCQYIEEKVLPDLIKTNLTKKQIVVEVTNFGGEPGIQEILEDFYNKKVKELKPKKFQSAVRKLCEKGLISPSGRRLSLAKESIVESYKVSDEVLDQLIDFRLLRKEPKRGISYYEICHDSMVKPILETAKERKQKRITRYLISSGLLILLIISILIVLFTSDKEGKKENIKLKYNYLKQELTITSENFYDILNKDWIEIDKQIEELEKSLGKCEENNNAINSLVENNKWLIKEDSSLKRSRIDTISAFRNEIKNLRIIDSCLIIYRLKGILEETQFEQASNTFNVFNTIGIKIISNKEMKEVTKLILLNYIKEKSNKYIGVLDTLAKNKYNSNKNAIIKEIRKRDGLLEEKRENLEKKVATKEIERNTLEPNNVNPDTSKIVSSPEIKISIDAVMLLNYHKPIYYYTFEGDKYNRYTVGKKNKDFDDPKPLPDRWGGDHWPPSWNSGIDAAVYVIDSTKTGSRRYRGYLFKKNKYLLLTSGIKADGDPIPLPGCWIGLPSSWNRGIDAAMYSEPNKKIYFFKGNKYIQITDTTVDDGYPKKLVEGWIGLPSSWNSGIDAAEYINGHTYFFKGDKYVRFTGTMMDQNYPKKIKGNWPEI